MAEQVFTVFLRATAPGAVDVVPAALGVVRVEGRRYVEIYGGTLQEVGDDWSDSEEAAKVRAAERLEQMGRVLLEQGQQLRTEVAT